MSELIVFWSPSRSSSVASSSSSQRARSGTRSWSWRAGWSPLRHCHRVRVRQRRCRLLGLPGGLTPGHAILVMEVAIALFVVVISLRNGRIMAAIMALAQLGSPSTWTSAVTSRTGPAAASSGSTGSPW